MMPVSVRRFPLPAHLYGARRSAQWLALHGLGLTPVIVYQMAKVGSSAIVDALLRSRLPTWHIHRMNPRHIARVHAERRALGWRACGPIAHETVSRQVHEKVVAPRKPARFITLVRDPVARNLSSYFEHLDAIWRTRNAHEVVPLADICAGFLQRYHHDDPLTWFDDELQPMLGIDVYAQPFPAAGHTVLKSGPFTLLVLKSELHDGVKQAALEDYLGLAVAPVRSANRTALKAKGAVYQQFTRAVRLTPAYVRELLHARYTRHFYTAEEREAIAHRYLDSTTHSW